MFFDPALRLSHQMDITSQTVKVIKDVPPLNRSKGQRRQWLTAALTKDNTKNGLEVNQMRCCKVKACWRMGCHMRKKPVVVMAYHII